MWDRDEVDARLAAVYTDQTLQAEPIFGGLYAMVTGKATAETLWSPAWVNRSAGDAYATLLLPSSVITPGDYRSYLEWVDLYTRIDRVQYNVFVMPNDYPARAEPPEYYGG
jgi:hypothetical protein